MGGGGGGGQLIIIINKHINKNNNLHDTGQLGLLVSINLGLTSRGLSGGWGKVADKGDRLK